MARWFDSVPEHHLHPAHFGEQLLAFAGNLPLAAEPRQFASEAIEHLDIRAVQPGWTVGAFVGATVQDQEIANGLIFEARLAVVFRTQLGIKQPRRGMDHRLAGEDQGLDHDHLRRHPVRAHLISADGFTALLLMAWSAPCSSCRWPRRDGARTAAITSRRRADELPVPPDEM
jgi:hypothetical protein